MINSNYSNYNYYSTQTYHPPSRNIDKKLKKVVDKSIELAADIIDDAGKELKFRVDQVLKDDEIPEVFKRLAVKAISDIVDPLKEKKVELKRMNRKTLYRNPLKVKKLLSDLKTPFANIIEQNKTDRNADRIHSLEVKKAQLSNMIKKISPYC